MNTLIVDGNNLLHRTFWVASMKHNKSIVSPIYLFLISLKKLVKDLSADDIIITWDHKLIKDQVNYRRLLCVDYKGNRDRTGRDDMYKQEKHIRDIVETLGVRNILPGVLEADDIIYWLCKKVVGNKIIASADSDLHQLIDSNTSVYDFNKKLEITPSNFKDVTGYESVDEYMQIKSLVGDKSDNISGLPRVGVKTARKILSDGISTLTEEQKEIYNRNTKLINLSTGLDVHPDEIPLYESQFNKTNKGCISTFKTACTKFNMPKISNKLVEWEEVFFNTTIENAAASCIHTLFKTDGNT